MHPKCFSSYLPSFILASFSSEHTYACAGGLGAGLELPQGLAPHGRGVMMGRCFPVQCWC